MAQTALTTATASAPASAEQLNQVVDAITGTLDFDLSLFQPLAPPAAPTATVSTSSGVLTGAYAYVVTFATGQQATPTTVALSGHTTAAGSASNTVTPSAAQVTLTGIPTGPTGVAARDLYRTKAGGSTYYYLATLSDDVTTDYTDNTADSALGSAAPTENTTGTPLTLPVYTTAPPGTAAGTLIGVSASGVTTLYVNDGTTWQPVGSTSAATTAALGLVEISTAPASGDPVAVTTTDPAYMALHGGTYIAAGSGLTSVAGVDTQALANTGVLGVTAGHGVVVTLASQTATLAVDETAAYTWTGAQTFDAGLTTPTVALAASSAAATGAGVLSQVGDQLYLGNGAAAVPVGSNPLTNPLAYAALF